MMKIIVDFGKDFIDPKSVGYAFMLQAFGMIFENVSRMFIDQYNYRFKKDYNDTLAQDVFYFFCINKFLPLMYIAFYIQSFLTLFSTLVTLVILD